MEEVDVEFGTLRKSGVKVDSDRIIKDINVDHVQSQILKTINLVPMKRMAENPVREITDDNNPLKKLKLFKSGEPNVGSEKVDIDYIKFKKHLLRNLLSRKIYPFLKDVYLEVDRILKQSIVQKESHSCILVGSRNSFKSAIVNKKLEELAKSNEKQFIVIRLNGFIHSEDSAIQGIATQLEIQLQKIHGGSKGSNLNISEGSLTEVFEKILKVLNSSSTKGEDKAKITVVFLFDEIDTFAGPVRQTLLYNLFDMIEHSRVPVCVFGFTTKLNILECFEKRVKSRFSQRIIYMPQIESLEDFNVSVKEMVKMEKIVDTGNLTYSNEWNLHVSRLIADVNSPFSNFIKQHYDTYNSLTNFKNSIVSVVGLAKSFDGLLKSLESEKSLNCYNNNNLGNSITSRIKSLSDLELVFLIASSRASMKSNDKSKEEIVNFNLAYEEFSTIIKTLNAKVPTAAPTSPTSTKNLNFNNVIKLWNRRDMKNIWESLQTLHFISERGAIGLRESAKAVFYASNTQMYGCNINFDLRPYQLQVTLEELRSIVPKSSMYYQWTQL